MGLGLVLTETSCCYHSWVNNSSRASLPAIHRLPNSEPLRTVFLDRDGVINRKMPEGQYVRGLEQFALLPGVPESVAWLNHAGLRVVVVTNQRGIALGLYSIADVERIHQQLQSQLTADGAHIDGFYFCPHDKQECTCRKPLPGLFEQAKADFPEIDAASSVIIGDSLSDIEFGHNLGMRTIFLEGDEYARLHQKPGVQTAATLADSCYATLPEAVQGLMQTPALGSKE